MSVFSLALVKLITQRNLERFKTFFDGDPDKILRDNLLYNGLYDYINFNHNNPLF